VAQPAAPAAEPARDAETEELSAADQRDLALETTLRAQTAERVTRKRTKVADPAPVEARPKQGDKTATIRNFVAAHPAGVVPKDILKHLRANFQWARESTTLANTVHTSLNNMIRRGLVAFEASTKTYTVIADAAPRAPGRPVVRSTEANPAEVAVAPAAVEPSDDAVVASEVEVEVEAAEAAEPAEIAPESPRVLSEEELAAKAAELRANPKPTLGLFDNNA
jgi:hypothetical protein